MMPAGNYYVGDLCYVLHDEWNEVCDLLFAGRDDHGCNEGEFTLADGRRFAIFNTAYGDGSYEDQCGRGYSVDSGSIGCILLNDIDLLNDQNCIRGGQVLEMPRTFKAWGDGGVMHFGEVVIDTAAEDWGDDDDYGYDEEEEEE